MAIPPNRLRLAGSGVVFLVLADAAAAHGERPGLAGQAPGVFLVPHAGRPQVALRQWGHAAGHLAAHRCQRRAVHGHADGHQPIGDAAAAAGGQGLAAELRQTSGRDLRRENGDNSTGSMKREDSAGKAVCDSGIVIIDNR